MTSSRLMHRLVLGLILATLASCGKRSASEYVLPEIPTILGAPNPIGKSWEEFEAAGKIWLDGPECLAGYPGFGQKKNVLRFADGLISYSLIQEPGALYLEARDGVNPHGHPVGNEINRIEKLLLAQSQPRTFRALSKDGRAFALTGALALYGVYHLGTNYSIRWLALVPCSSPQFMRFSTLAPVQVNKLVQTVLDQHSRYFGGWQDWSGPTSRGGALRRLEKAK